MTNASTLNIDIIKKLILNDVNEMGFAFSLPEFIDNNIKNGIFENSLNSNEQVYKVNDSIFILDNKKDENDSRHWIETKEDKLVRKSIGFAVVKDSDVHCFDIVIARDGKLATITNENKIQVPLTGNINEITSFYYCPDDNGVLLTGNDKLFKTGMIQAFTNMNEKKFYFSSI